MTLIEQIKEDMERGTPGKWLVKSLKGHCTDYIVTDHPCFQERPHQNYVGETGNSVGKGVEYFEYDSRRIARVPDMEAALLAAEELAEALDAFEATGCQQSVYRTQVALKAYRAATGASQ